MKLCFGSYATVLKLCSHDAVTNRILISKLVRLVDKDASMDEDGLDWLYTKLMGCKADFNKTQSAGKNRDIGTSRTSILTLVHKVKTQDIVSEFEEEIIPLLIEDKKHDAVLYLKDILLADKSCYDAHSQMFLKYMGIDAASAAILDKVHMPQFLSGLFLYSVAIAENKSEDGANTVADIKKKDFLERQPRYIDDFELIDNPEDEAPVAEPATRASFSDGLQGYLKRLVDKYNCLPTILHKEAFTPFRDYYVPNDVTWRVKKPDDRYSYEYKRASGVTLPKLIDISRFLVLSGTGGLGKSMMMRNLILSSAEGYDSLGLVPLFITLKDYNANYANLSVYILEMVCNLWPELSTSGLTALLSSGKALLLFDGLDEISSKDLTVFTRQLNAFLDRFDSNAFVISSRPYSNFQSFTRFTVLQLQPFTKDQALELVDRFNYRADSPKLQAKFRSLLANSLYYTHQGFSDNPLLLSIMLLTFEMDADVPTMKHIFYQEAFTVLSKRHDATKDGYTRTLRTEWTANEFEHYFSFFCAISYSNSDVSFTYSQMEDYFRLMDDKYDLWRTNVDDFIYDATNNLCIMYQDGLNYGFIHRSFQEYFCAKFFHSQLDEELENIIPVFDCNDETKKDDTALPMLFDMKPQAVERYMILPYLRTFVGAYEAMKGIWSFLETMYPEYEVGDGDAYADDDLQLPHSNLYAFILSRYEVPLLSVDPDALAGIHWAEAETMVYREDIKKDVWKYEVPSDYEQYYGEPEETGHIYRFDWERIQTESYYRELKRAIESETSPFMKEYLAIKELLARLEKKNAPKPYNTSLFDRLS